MKKNSLLNTQTKSVLLAGILVLVLALVSTPTRTLGGQFNSEAAGGNWSVGATWSGGIAPADDTTTDWVYISGGGVVTNDATRSVGGLLTAGANLNINADLTIGNHNWFNSCSTFIGSGSSSSVMQAAGTTVTIGDNMKMSLGPDSGAVGDYTVGTNATLSVAGGLWIGDNTSSSLGSGSLTNNGGTINVGSFANGLLVGGGNLVINSGTLTVGTKLDLGLPSHTLTNNLIINGGTVTVSNQLVLGAHGQPGFITQNGGRLQVVNGALYCGGYGDGSGTGTFTQNGGTNTVATAVNFGGYGPNSGIYNLNGGRLVTPVLANTGSGTATFNFNGGTLVPSGNSATFLEGLTAANMNTNSVIDTAGFDITVAQPLLVGNGGGLTKTGLGTLILSGGTTNTFSGPIAVMAGNLGTLNGASIKNVTNTIAVAAGATFNLKGAFDGNASSNPFSLAGTGTGANGGWGALNVHENVTINGPITLLADAKITHDWNDTTFNSTITGTNKNLQVANLQPYGQPGLNLRGSISLGAGALTVGSVSGALPVYLTASNNYTGGTLLTNYGKLVLNNSYALGTGGLTLYANTLLDLNANSISIASLSGTGGLITDNASGAGTTAITVNQSGATTFAGVITNGASRTVALTLSGPGALSLTAANTFTGATAVNAGELIGVTGGSCSNSAVTVASGATNGVQVTATGGQWACGNLTYNSGTTYVDFNFVNTQPSTTVAPLLVNGNLAINGTLDFVIRNGAWASAGTYPLVSYTGTLSGTVPGSVFGLPPGLTATLVNNTGSKRIDLSVSAVTVVASSYNTWTNLVSGNAGGVWGTNVNWSPNTVPNGVSAVADFSTVTITVNSSVTNDTARTVGALSFANGSGRTWTVDGGTDKQLTLAAGAIVPTINVTNTQVLLGGFNGTNGFVKNGNGALAIYGQNYTNSLSGPIVVNGGLLGTVNSGTFKYITGPITVASGASFEANANFQGDVFSNTLYLSGTGSTPSGYVANAATPDGTYNGAPPSFGALDLHGNATYSGTINLNADSLITHGYNVATITGPIVASGTGKNLELAITVSGQYPIFAYGSINLGSGALTVNSVSGGGSGDGCAVALNAANTYSGGTVLTNYAILRLGNAGALGSGGLTLNPNTSLNLNTYGVSIASLSGAAGSSITDLGAAGTTTLTVNQSVATTFSGVITNGVSRTVALTLSGTGALSLAGNNTYTGATAVNTGKLIGVTGGSCSNSAITVASGATNGVLVATAGGQWACGALTYGSGTTYADFNFGANAPGATAPLLVNGNLTLTGTTLDIIVRSSAGITNGVYPLLKYTGTLAGTPPTAAFSLPAAWGGSISNDTANKSLVLVVTNGTVMQWAVGNEVWDINTTGNWKDTDGTTGLKYFDGNTVTFDDTASGTSPIYVTNNSTVTPGSLTINNTTKAYVITGSGNISGSTALVKTGSGGSSLTLGGTNTFSGGTINSGGTLKLDSDFALGTGSLTVQSGGGNPTVILDLNGHTVTNTIATTGGDCYVRNTSPSAATLSGPVTIGSYTRLGFYSDTTYGSVGSMTLSGTYSGGWYDKQGASLLALTGTNTYAGSTIINGGVVRAVDGVGITTANLVINDANSVGAVFESASGGNLVRALGSGANQVQLNNGSCGFSAYGAAATVSLGGLGTPASLVWGSAYFYPSSLVLNYYSANTNLTLANAIDLNGTNRNISVYASVATIAGVISNSTGTAGITKLGAGTLVLTNASTYTGNTVISAGTLALSGSGSIVSTPQITVAGSAIFDVSGLSSTFTLGSARTLSNSASATGTLNGNLNASAGTNSVSYVSGTPAFTVTNGTLTLSGSTVFKVNNTGAQLAHGNHKIIAKATSGNVGLVAGSLPAVTVSGGGAAAPVSLQLVSGELYLNVNTAPVAQNISMGAQVGVLQTLPILTGKHAAFDSDSDTLTISAVTSGTNGGVVVISGGNVTYSNNVIGSDSFTYTVNDGYGGTDTKTVLVSVSNVINQQASITYSGGTVSLTFWGVPGTSYTIQRATDVNGPWTDLSTVAANTSQPIGQVSLSDTPPANGSYFYRLKP